MMKVICDICKSEFDSNRGANEDGYMKIAHVEITDSRCFRGKYDVCNNCIIDIRNFIKNQLEFRDQYEEE